MENIIYSIEDINEFSIETNDKGILYVSNHKSNEENEEVFTFNRDYCDNEIELHNKILSIGDIVYKKIKKNKNSVIKILGGDILINNYLVIIANIMQIKIYIENIELHKFDISLDIEEQLMYKSVLNDKISNEEYKILPDHWKNIYYIRNDKIVISEFWKGILENARNCK